MHLFGDAAQAVTWARAAGFENVNLDLIFGIPHQTLAMWQATLNRTLALGPDHLSCYALSLEHGTPMRAWVYRGLLPLPDPDLAAEMYEWASATLAANGYVQYEISNWAKIKDEGLLRRMKDENSFSLSPSSFSLVCKHNLQYWRNLPYLGFGAGAHGCVNGWRYSDVLAPSAYIERLKQAAEAEFPFSPAVAQKIAVTAEDAMNETMMLGMRLTREGVRAADFRARFGVGLAEKYPRQLKRLRELGLLEWDETGARLTKGGKLLGNRVFREFV
jgi:oxygen-independent coproporphyrinogen-3 oxidase